MASVQKAIHVSQDITWAICSDKLNYTSTVSSVIPIYFQLIKGNYKILVYSGMLCYVIFLFCSVMLCWSVRLFGFEIVTSFMIDRILHILYQIDLLFCLRYTLTIVISSPPFSGDVDGAVPYVGTELWLNSMYSISFDYGYIIIAILSHLILILLLLLLLLLNNPGMNLPIQSLWEEWSIPTADDGTQVWIYKRSTYSYNIIYI